MKPWESQLIQGQGDGTLVHIARQGRLNYNGSKVDLTWVDEAALALVEAAVVQKQTLNLVYPAPAGEVAVLLAAQILLRGFIDQSKCSSVGILTADAPNAARIWDELALTSKGSRAPLNEVFPCYRPSVDGRSPSNGKLRGVLIGNNCEGWPVDVTIVDHLAGPTVGKPRGTIIRIFADPLDPVLDEIGRRGELIWGWSDSILQLWHEDLQAHAPNTVPFSVAEDRFKAISKGVEITLQVCQHEFAEKPLAKVREDLAALSRQVGPAPSRKISLGLRVAWSHVATLAALPCRPNEYDEFCGVPPRAARPTSTFAKEIEAWSATLDESQKEYGMILASDLADLRRALEMGSAFRSPLLSLAHAEHRSLAILRTRTAVMRSGIATGWSS